MECLFQNLIKTSYCKTHKFYFTRYMLQSYPAVTAVTAAIWAVGRKNKMQNKMENSYL